MTTTRTTSARILDTLDIMSTTTGGLGVVLTVWGQSLKAERHAFHVNNGHPMMDGNILFAPMPGFIFTVLAIGLGAPGLRAQAGGRAWAIVGIVVGAIAVALTLTGIPVGLVPNPWVEPMVR